MACEISFEALLQRYRSVRVQQYETSSTDEELSMKLMEDGDRLLDRLFIHQSADSLWQFSTKCQLFREEALNRDAGPLTSCKELIWFDCIEADASFMAEDLDRFIQDARRQKS
ncbi:MAG: hypothetical protein AAGH38_02665 [Pseudomonadota bacterium]